MILVVHILWFKVLRWEVFGFGVKLVQLLKGSKVHYEVPTMESHNFGLRNKGNSSNFEGLSWNFRRFRVVFCEYEEYDVLCATRTTDHFGMRFWGCPNYVVRTSFYFHIWSLMLDVLILMSLFYYFIVMLEMAACGFFLLA